MTIKPIFDVRLWIRLSLAGVFALIIIGSCVHEPFPVEGPVANGNNGGIENCVYQGVCFESSVLPIFISSCAKSGCHDATTHEEGYNLTSYAGIMKKGISIGSANDSKLFKVLTASGSDRMPPSPDPSLTKAQRDSIAKWINQGAKFTTQCNCQCDATQFAYATIIEPLMKTNCVGCHSVASPGGNINLSTYVGVKAIADNGRLVGSVTHATGFVAMPQGARLSDCQTEQIKQWVAAGALNN
jgi:Planctomycete cytochrome C